MARNVEFNEAEAIQKAMRVFWEKGYHGASLRDLTTAMQINSSSLYNTIGDKEELFVRCVQHYTDLRKQDWQLRLASERPALEVLVEYIQCAVDIIIAEENSCLAIKAAFEMATSDERVRAILKADSEYGEAFLRELLRKAVAQGAIQTEESPELLADYFNSTWKGWHESYILHKDPIRIKKMAQYFIKQIGK
ncbi:TetR/AcrR family transcriptional regulator [Hymenobacter crusticola]|uniref:TetR family transcriptional regulator n=1 Tax=Hymenobacter crusticola TaxID=1770526 RepID=A0A243WBB1_9BACT|nr:TetR/AcrR family transcriptional regulator [Hymenobacter crusticola]OUJ72891.1 TetR family transcriptional regulator [Hymenobacter crusticola]